MNTGLFEVLSEKFKLQDETILSHQYYKLTREQNKNTEEWMDQIKLKVNDCGYSESTRRLRAVHKCYR